MKIEKLKIFKPYKQHIPPLPFPPRAVSNKKMEEAKKEILETFRKVEVNIPLLDAIKKIPRYAKFLKGVFVIVFVTVVRKKNVTRNIYPLPQT